MTSATRPGPRRPDTHIFAEARKALDDCPSMPATVRVHVEDGVVWLTGMAQRPAQRTEAEAVVRAVDGVRGVVNKIMVAESPNADEFGPEA